MDDRKRQALESLHRECIAALGKLVKESEEMCRLLGAIKRHPVSLEERRALLEQRVRENDAQSAYNSVRQALFALARWK